MKTFKIIFLFSFVLIWRNSDAQQVLATSGTTFQNQVCVVTFTVGEALTGNFAVSNCIVSQGFQQAYGSSTSFLDYLDESSISIFPNPTHQIIYIKGLEVGEKAAVEILNLQGSTVLLVTEFEDDHLDVSSLSKGFYLLQISSHQKRIIEKLIIE